MNPLRTAWPRRRIAVAVALCFAVAVPSAAQSPPPAGSPAPAAAPASAAADRAFTQEELDQMLAPIALYPDSLLAQAMMAATYPIEVVQADRWVKANPSLKGKALEDALQKQPWDPAVKGIAAVPQVLTMMSEKLDWTQKLGDAYLSQPKEVATTVQALRQKAQDQGNLKDSKEQKVVTEKVESTTIIKIEQAQPDVVYVPTYNPTVVYGSWWYPSYPPYYYHPPGYYPGAGLVGFTAGVIVGGALWGNWNWGGGDINIDVDRYNNFNRTNISNTNREWNHNADHRGAVPYKDRATATKYDRGGNSPGAGTREAYRGRGEGGAGAGTPRAGNMDANRAGNLDSARTGGAAGNYGGNRAGSTDAGRAGNLDSARAGGAAGNYGGNAAGNRAGSMDAGRGSGAFNSGSAAQTRSASQRGASSMQGARGGGGGGRAGGGGGRGGGGRR